MGFQIRYWIIVLIFLTTYINFMTRVNLAVSIIPMTASPNRTKCCNGTINDTETYNAPHLEWDQQLQGYILGSYFWGYVLVALVSGLPAEQFGSCQVIFWTTLFTAILNAACVPAALYHFGLLMLCRFLMGVLGSFVYPSLIGLIARWSPPEERGLFSSALMGNTVSTCINWPFVGWVSTEFGWDWGFYILSIKCIVFCILFCATSSNTPASNRCITMEEVLYIQERQEGVSAKTKLKAPYIKILKSFPFWILNILHFGSMWGLYLQLQGIPKYMKEVLCFNLKSSGFIAAVPHVCRAIFGFVFGVLSDLLITKNVLSVAAVRKSFVVFSHIIPGLLIMAITKVDCSRTFATILLSISLGFNGAVVVTNLQGPYDLAPNFAGTVFAIMSFVGGSTGFIVPAVTGWLIRDTSGPSEWGQVFLIGGGVYAISGIIFMFCASTELQEWNEVDE